MKILPVVSFSITSIYADNPKHIQNPQFKLSDGITTVQMKPVHAAVCMTHQQSTMTCATEREQ
jgi:hypothetical protein